MEFLFEFGIFAAKAVFIAIIIVFTFLSVVFTIKAVKSESSKDDKFKFTNLIEEYEKNKESIEDALFDYDDSIDEKTKKKELKLKEKNKDTLQKEKKEQKEARIKNAEEEGRFCPERLFVIDFDGDTKASEQDLLKRKINLILSVANDKDEVIVNLDSPGGVVNGYGLCAAQLERLRNKGVHLTVCVDNVAASGGYLMSCVASKIVAAPFSYIGSIGVVASMPNFNKVLKKNDVDYELVTAGKYKRTLTVFGENTPEAREKFKSELEGIHTRFKEIVSKYRPSMNIDDVSTGEFWLAKDALERGLVDEINTFDGYLQNSLEFTKHCAIKISIEEKENNTLKSIIGRFFNVKSWTQNLLEEISESSNTKNIH